MGWLETSSNQERKTFISEWLKKEHTFAGLCKRFAISRKTGYKLVNRYLVEGEEAFRDRSCARHNHPNRTPESIEAKLLEMKYRYSAWGPATIKAKLELECPEINWPAASTIGEIYKRYGLVKPRKKRRKVVAHSQPFLLCDAPNKVWSIDYKGQFRLGNNTLCYPLTITDNYSRFILGCEGLVSTELVRAKRVLRQVFEEYGLPEAIRTDNGTPFASRGIGGLSQLSVWWLKLGIMPERIAAGHPEQNGRHERMHRTLKAATTLPPGYYMQEQNKKFDAFRKEFNFERPHQGINFEYPNNYYRKSERAYSDNLEEISYPDNFIVRKVRSNGEIKWQGKCIYLGELLYGEPVGLEMIDDDRAVLYFSKLKLGIIDARRKRVIRPGKR